MPATKTQRFTLYLLTLLFVWVNGFAAPYQCITDLPHEVVVRASLKQQDTQQPFEELDNSQLQFQQPMATTDQGIHSAYPPEEAFEEQEESHQRKDEDGLVYIILPKFMAQVSLSNINIIHPPHHEWNSAMRKQSTYLLDCSFLI